MEKHVALTLKYPYYTLNTLTEKTEKVWIVFHGYGMLSKYFIRKFSILDSEKNYIICPQGLSKFYLDGFSGRVGATWMTKEDRLTEIENQKRYISEVLSNELEGQHGKTIIYLGFSQGVATVCRFLSNTKFHFDQLILWSGTFPEDISPENTAHWPPSSKMIYVTGLNDPYLKPGMIENQHRIVQKTTGRDIERIEFEGKHEIDENTLLKLS